MNSVKREPHRPSNHVCLLGHTGHGKTTLVEAIKGLTGTPEWYNPPLRAYEEIRTGSEKEQIQDISRMDAAVLVVSATEGPMAQTRKHLYLAREFGKRSLVVFLNKCDLMEEVAQFERIENQVRNLLDKYGYGATVPIIRGSAIQELGIQALINAVEQTSHISRFDSDAFLMEIEKVYSVRGTGTVALGYVNRGVLDTNQQIDVVGMDKAVRRTIGSFLQQLHRFSDRIVAGATASLHLRGMSFNNVMPGMVLAAPDSIRAYSKFAGTLYLPSEDEGGSQISLGQGTWVQFTLHGMDVFGKIVLSEDNPSKPGTRIEVSCELTVPMALEVEQRFVVKDGAHTLGIGTITQLRNDN